MNNYLIGKWGLQPVRRCCKGSQLARVAPAQGFIMKITKTRLKQIIKEELQNIKEQRIKNDPVLALYLETLEKRLKKALGDQMDDEMYNYLAAAEDLVDGGRRDELLDYIKELMENFSDLPKERKVVHNLKIMAALVRNL